MSQPTTAPAIPDLEFRAPDCPMCGAETDAVDHAFDCEGCNLTWGSDGRHGERMDPCLPKCEAQIMPHEEKTPTGSLRWPTLAGRTYECVLDATHVEGDVPHRGVHINGRDEYYVDTHLWDVVRTEVKA